MNTGEVRQLITRLIANHNMPFAIEDVKSQGLDESSRMRCYIISKQCKGVDDNISFQLHPQGKETVGEQARKSLMGHIDNKH